jgi:hypothetical protein
MESPAVASHPLRDLNGFGRFCPSSKLLGAQKSQKSLAIPGTVDKTDSDCQYCPLKSQEL